jgi:NAD+ kinase
MSTVAVLVNPRRADARQLAGEVSAWLGASGHRSRVLLVEGLDRVVEDAVEKDLVDLDLSGADLAVSLGGDGTFLRLVPLAWSADVPVLGVNFGRLGYLLELRPDQLQRALDQALAGDVVIDERWALCVSVTSGEPNPDRPGSQVWFALNELVLEKTVFGHTVRLGTSIDGEDFITYSADGLIISTPTGSTAYNLSAGGPVLSPRLRAMVLTPVAAHLSFDRSLVLHPDQVVTVRVMDERAAALVIDGQDAGRLAPGTEVTCKLADRPVRLVTSGERGFGRLLKETLASDRDS